MSEMLRAANLSKVFEKGGTSIEVLTSMDLTVQAGESVAIVGASGVGKSTLLNLLGALDRPTAGSIHFEGADLFSRDERDLAEFRNLSIGYVFQFHYLLPEFTALENTAIPLWIRGMSASKAESIARESLSSVGLDHRLGHLPGELSGGEQQRVAIARALSTKPKLLLADEPTGNLDAATAGPVVDLLFGAAREGDRAMVIVTHNPEISKKADRVLRMELGHLEDVTRAV